VVVPVVLFAPAVFPAETKDVVGQTKLSCMSFVGIGLFASLAFSRTVPRPPVAAGAGAGAGLPGAPGARRAGVVGGLGAGAGAGAGWRANPGTIAWYLEGRMMRPGDEQREVGH
jgi:hypothetical protein